LAAFVSDEKPVFSVAPAYCHVPFAEDGTKLKIAAVDAERFADTSNTVPGWQINDVPRDPANTPTSVIVYVPGGGE